MTKQVLLGDIGGTHARFAIASEGVMDEQTQMVYHCDHFDSLHDAIKHYLRSSAS